MLNLNMLGSQQNSMCYLLHESRKVLIYSKGINLLDGHNYLWLKENNHSKKFSSNPIYKCIFQNYLSLKSKF